MEVDGEVGSTVLPEGEFAVGLHQGDYADLGQAYAEIFGGWIPRQGLHVGEPPTLERYLNHPGSTPAHELRTEIWVRLAGDRDQA